ncbi:MAG: flagellar hook-length control protein FliK [Campylobacterales bacterium]|nr:flagellar hook-length control protein FliK [Campylobacterales bacterium]
MNLTNILLQTLIENKIQQSATNKKDLQRLPNLKQQTNQNTQTFDLKILLDQLIGKFQSSHTSKEQIVQSLNQYKLLYKLDQPLDKELDNLKQKLIKSNIFLKQTAQIQQIEQTMKSTHFYDIKQTLLNMGSSYESKVSELVFDPKNLVKFNVINKIVDFLVSNIPITAEKSTQSSQLSEKKFFSQLDLFIEQDSKISQNINPKDLKTLVVNFLEDIKIDSKVDQQKFFTKLPNLLDHLNQKLDFHKTMVSYNQIFNDLKNTLIQIEQQLQKLDQSNMEQFNLKDEIEKLNNKLLAQIEYTQIYSYITNSYFNFLPITQMDLEQGEIKFFKNNDETFSCHIELNLEKYEKVKIYLLIDKKNNLQIDIGATNKEFLHLLNQSLQTLRSNMFKNSINTQQINIFKLDNHRSTQFENIEVFNYGLDIKA